ncbi:MAG TPA: hypothetical protein VJO53_01355 [Candidatus Acidoferrales bacterium]|nr:hypothetical protein [Candidatus Acidoferrales bacterium]
MKRILGLGALMLGCSLPAHAQFLGGTIGGAGSSGVSFPVVIDPAPTHFAVSYVGGTGADFVPSSFLSYDKALAAGRAAVEAQTKSLAQIADENNRAQKAKAKFALVQDARGNAFIAKR